MPTPLLTNTIMENYDVVEKNIKLIYFIINRKLCITNNVERMYAISAGYDGLVNAAKNFNSEKGYTFASYATVCIINSIKRDRVVRYRENKLVFNIDEQDDLESPNDIISYVDKDYDRYVLKLACDKLKTMKPRDTKIFIEYLCGHSYKKIAKKYNITTQRLYKILSNIRNKITIDKLDKRYNE